MQPQNSFNVAFPFAFGPTGRVSGTTYEKHVSQQVEQVLFTSPGERVNLPEFGCGLLNIIFEPMSDELLSGLEAIIAQSLQRWLTGVVQVQHVSVNSNESEVTVDVSYKELASGATRHNRYEASTTP